MPTEAALILCHPEAKNPKAQKPKSPKVKSPKVKRELRSKVLRPRAIERRFSSGFVAMSLLLEHGRKKRRILPKWSSLDAPLARSHPNQILTFHEWCRLNRISVRTGRRIIASGNGPTVTQLSPQRIGISVANNAL